MSAPPFGGKQIWVVNLLSNPAELVLAAMELGCTGIFVKAGDGTDFLDQIVGVKEAMLDLGYAGMLWAWIYCYGDNIAGEVATVVQALEQGEPDCLCLDVEQEIVNNGGMPTAVNLMNAVRASKAGYATIGYTSFGSIRNHTNFPFQVFNGQCQVFFPQIYYADFGLTPQVAISQCVTDMKSWFVKPPAVAPMGQAYGSAAPADIQAFGDQVKADGFPGFSFYDLDSATGLMLKVIKDL